jgi:hypothetical protein
MVAMPTDSHGRQAPIADASGGQAPIADASLDVRTATPVVLAFGLGWNVSRLYASGQPCEPSVRIWSKDWPLVDGHRLLRFERTKIWLDSALASRSRLCETFSALRIELPDPQRLRTAYSKAATAEEFHKAVYLFDMSLVQCLKAGSEQLARAYSLGRSLENLKRVEGPKQTQKALRDQKVRALQDTLRDLNPWFPSHAASAVSISLGWWAHVVHLDGIWADGSASAPRIREILTRQVDRWRDLLVGETQGMSQLRDEDYVQAAVNMARRSQGIASQLLRPFAPTIAVVAGLALLGIAAIVLLPGVGKIVAGFSALAIALGLTWKGLNGALNELAGRLRGPLWQREIDTRIASRIDMAASVPGLPDDGEPVMWHLLRRSIFGRRNTAGESAKGPSAATLRRVPRQTPTGL